MVVILSVSFIERFAKLLKRPFCNGAIFEKAQRMIHILGVQVAAAGESVFRGPESSESQRTCRSVPL
jgi:hypothetical protein